MRLKKASTASTQAEEFNDLYPLRSLSLVYTMIDMASKLGLNELRIYVTESVCYRLMPVLDKNDYFYSIEHTHLLPDDFIFNISWHTLKSKKNSITTESRIMDSMRNSL